MIMMFMIMYDVYDRDHVVALIIGCLLKTKAMVTFFRIYHQYRYAWGMTIDAFWPWRFLQGTGRAADLIADALEIYEEELLRAGEEDSDAPDLAVIQRDQAIYEAGETLQSNMKCLNKAV